MPDASNIYRILYTVYKFQVNNSVFVYGIQKSSLNSKMSLLMVGTRIHGKNVNIAKVDEFCEQASEYGDVVAIAVSVENGNTENYDHLVEVAAKYPRVHVIPLSYWGNICPALNALTSFASKMKCTHILFQSFEIQPMPQAVQVLRNAFSAQDLVLGAALPGHAFTIGCHRLTALTSPWNTFALWSVMKLAKIGFLQISEGLIRDLSSGMEELPVISILQGIDKENNHQARLIQVPGITWDVESLTPERRKAHEAKMASKTSRAEEQMRVLGISPGSVTHFITMPC